MLARLAVIWQNLKLINCVSSKSKLEVHLVNRDVYRIEEPADLVSPEQYECIISGEIDPSEYIKNGAAISIYWLAIEKLLSPGGVYIGSLPVVDQADILVIKLLKYDYQLIDRGLLYHCHRERPKIYTKFIRDIERITNGCLCQIYQEELHPNLQHALQKETGNFFLMKHSNIN